MSEAALIWFAGIVVTVLLGVLALWYRHTRDCNQQRVMLAKAVESLDGKVERLLDEVGRDHDSGIRGRMHNVENILSPSFLRWQMEQERKR